MPSKRGATYPTAANTMDDRSGPSRCPRPLRLMVTHANKQPPYVLDTMAVHGAPRTAHAAGIDPGWGARRHKDSVRGGVIGIRSWAR